MSLFLCCCFSKLASVYIVTKVQTHEEGTEGLWNYIDESVEGCQQEELTSSGLRKARLALGGAGCIQCDRVLSSPIVSYYEMILFPKMT